MKSKSQILLSFLLIISTVVSAQYKEKNDWQTAGLKGKVKTMHEIFYEPKSIGDSIVKGEKKNKDEDAVEAMVTYNEYGYKTSEIRYSTDGAVEFKLVYAYDDKFHRIKEDRFSSEGTLLHAGRFDYAYDDAGKVLKERMLNSKGSGNERTEYMYDRKSNLIGKNRFNSHDSLESGSLYIYDSKNKLVEQREIESDSSVSWKITYSLDSTGRISDETWFKKGEKFYIRYAYEYDSHGNISSLNWLNENGKILTHWTSVYLYDINGNWIQKTQYKNSKAWSVAERIIEYF